MHEGCRALALVRSFDFFERYLSRKSLKIKVLLIRERTCTQKREKFDTKKIFAASNGNIFNGAINDAG